MSELEFKPFPKIPRFKSLCIITEKIDGTNAQVLITDDGQIRAGSRSRWVTPGKGTDNYGFAAWVEENKEVLVAQLGPGRHFGEWWGQGVQKRYNVTGKRLSLFNAHRWTPAKAAGALTVCDVVPTLYEGEDTKEAIDAVFERLRTEGSVVAPGSPAEGIVICFPATGGLMKRTYENDNRPKGMTALTQQIEALQRQVAELRAANDIEVIIEG